MGSIVEGVKTVNSVVRTLLLAASAGVLGWGGYMVYSEVTKRDRLLLDKEQVIEQVQGQLLSLQSELDLKLAEVGQLNQTVQEQQVELDKLETALHLLKTDQRLARLNVVKVERDEKGVALTSTLEFVELSPSGAPLSPPKSFELPGDVVYIDNWVVKFDDRFIEKADIERGTSLCLFRRIFSEQQTPTEGISLDEIGMRPQAYARGGALSEFEQSLWSDFWEFANDPAKATEMGIRAANGEAISIKVREGKAYSISLRASGGLSIEPIESIEPSDSPR
jgi:hypothetical protein